MDMQIVKLLFLITAFFIVALGTLIYCIMINLYQIEQKQKKIIENQNKVIKFLTGSDNEVKNLKAILDFDHIEPLLEVQKPTE